MSAITIPDEQWSKIYAFCRSCKHVHDYGEANLRHFMQAVLWIMRSGAQWRLLPAQYGKWNSVYKRYARWCELGVWEEMFHHFVQDPDLEEVLFDSTSIRAHACAAGAAQKKGGNPPRHSDVAVAASAPRSTQVSMLSAIHLPSS